MMKRLALALGLVLAAPASAADTIPQQFVGKWCEFGTIPAGGGEHLTLYERTGCKYAEDEMIVQPTAVFIAEEVICKLAKVTVEGKLHRLALDCNHVVTGRTWSYEIYFQRSAHRLITQQVESKK